MVSINGHFRILHVMICSVDKNRTTKIISCASVQESALTRFIAKDKVSRFPFFSIAHVLLTYKIFEMKIHPEIGISLCRRTFSHRLFTKSGILPANSVISEVMIACTEFKTQI